jgi:hypothetical protein
VVLRLFDVGDEERGDEQIVDDDDLLALDALLALEFRAGLVVLSLEPAGHRELSGLAARNGPLGDERVHDGAELESGQHFAGEDLEEQGIGSPGLVDLADASVNEIHVAWCP